MRDRIKQLRSQLFDKNNRDLESLDKLEHELISIQNEPYIDNTDKDLARWTQRQLRRKYLSIKFPPQFGIKLSPAAAYQVLQRYGNKKDKGEEDGEDDDT